MHEVDWDTVEITFTGQAQEELARLGPAIDPVHYRIFDLLSIGLRGSVYAPIIMGDACSPDTSQPYPF